MSGEIHSQIAKVLVTMDWSIFGLCFSKMEHSLELSVVGVMLLVSDCYEIQVSSSLV